MWSNVLLGSRGQAAHLMNNNHNSKDTNNHINPGSHYHGSMSMSSKSSTSSASNSSTNHKDSNHNQSKQETVDSEECGKGKHSNGSPLMRYKHAICSSTNGFIYIHGGRFGNLPLGDDLWRFDAHESTWSKVQTSGSKPPSLQEHSLVEYRDQLYLFGGQVSASQQEENFWRLDLATMSWQTLTQRSSRKFGAYLGPTNRRSHSAVIYKDCMYVFGGYEDLRGSSGQLWQYDLLNERWELRCSPNSRTKQSTSQPEPRHAHSAIVYQDSMYIYGGLNNLKPLSDLWRWSWKDRRWYKERIRGHSPGQLYGHSAIEAFGSMFVFGGERNGRPRSSLWRLDFSTMSWHKIRAKGPRPLPICWHAATSNPLNILDEANYIIENGEAQGMSSLSENCFSLVQNRLVNGEEQPLEMVEDLQDGVGVAQFGDEELAIQNQEETPAEGSHGREMTDSGSLRVQKLAMKQRQLRGKLRRRLSFLSRRKSGHRGASSSTSCDELVIQQQQQKQFPKLQSSLSACEDFIASSEMEKKTVVMNGRFGSAESKIEVRQEMNEPTDVQQTNAHILDSLDSDIKQMFGETEMEPTDEIDEDEQCSIVTALQPQALKRHSVQRDSMTQSQLSSYLGTSSYRTARENLTSISQTTITDEQQSLLNSGSTVTITQHPKGVKTLQEEPQLGNLGKLGPVSVRRRTRDGSSSTSQRPRSEIVQSLIDRADARIKHIYTPFFHQANSNGLQSHRGSTLSKYFDPNDPLLSRLMNEKTLSADGTHETNRLIRESARNALMASNPHYADDPKSKRHTIHQTMTYYNLYFAEEHKSQSSPSDESSETKNPVDQKREQNCDESSMASTTRPGSTSNTISSTTAALIGVRDSQSVTSGQPRTTGENNQDTLSSISSGSTARQSADSRTLCHEIKMENGEPGHSKQIGGSAQLARDEIPGEFGYTGGYDHSGKVEVIDHHRKIGLQLQEELTRRHRTNHLENGGYDLDNDLDDNTSLSFSAIAEFEEDDMLQYSSPTDMGMQPNQGNRKLATDSRGSSVSMSPISRHCNEEEIEPNDSPKTNRMQVDQSSQLELDNFEQIEPGSRKMRPEKSSSTSGYDSNVSSSVGFGMSRFQGINADYQQNHKCSVSSEQQKQLSNNFLSSNCSTNHGQHRTTTSTTADSLALTTATTSNTATSDLLTSQSPSPINNNQSLRQKFKRKLNNSDQIPSKSLPSSPPDNVETLGKSGQKSHVSLTTMNIRKKLSLMSRSSRRLFGSGKGKTKTRYWQLCMFVIGGKQEGTTIAHGMNEPISIWRLYI